MVIKSATSLLIGVAAASASATAAQAELASATVSEAADRSHQEPSPAAASSSNWEVQFTPYIWAAGINGRIGIPRINQSITVDRSFGDLLSDLDFGVMGTLDARRKQLVLSADVLILRSSAKAETIRDISFLSGRSSSDVTVVSALAGYRAVDQGRTYVDLLAGARYASVSAELSLTALNRTVRASSSSDGISAVVGTRAQVPLSDRLALQLQGDAGLFSPAVRWQLMGGLSYDISRRWAATLGYRHMKIKRSNDRLDINADLSGPMLGVTVRF